MPTNKPVIELDMSKESSDWIKHVREKNKAKKKPAKEQEESDSIKKFLSTMKE